MPSPQCCQTLVSHHVDPSLRDEDGYTAADLAEYHGHQDCAQYLRETARPVRLGVPCVLTDQLARKLRVHHVAYGKKVLGQGQPHKSSCWALGQELSQWP